MTHCCYNPYFPTFHHHQPLDGTVSFRMVYLALFCPCSLMTKSNIDLKMFQINIFHYLRSRPTQQRHIVFIKVHCAGLCEERGRKTETEVTAIFTVHCSVLLSLTVILAVLMCCVVLSFYRAFWQDLCQWLCVKYIILISHFF